MVIHVTIDNPSGEESPDPESMRSWLNQCFSRDASGAELCIRIVSEQESRQLNHQYRGKDYATNVLSFPAQIPTWVNSPLLGDLAICAALVAREAKEQQKDHSAHWAHMLIHGTLHLLGHDHQEDSAADAMERLETKLLTSMGFPPPYEYVHPQ